MIGLGVFKWFWGVNGFIKRFRKVNGFTYVYVHIQVFEILCCTNVGVYFVTYRSYVDVSFQIMIYDCFRGV